MDLKTTLKLLVLVLPIIGQAYLSVRFLLKGDFVGSAIAIFTLNVMIIFVYKAISEKKI